LPVQIVSFEEEVERARVICARSMVEEIMQSVTRQPEALISIARVKDVDECTYMHHHEKADGSGYPHGLKDEDISQLAAMGAVCDIYDAITSDRPYRKGWNPSEVIRKMVEWSKGHFKEATFRAFVRAVGIYPSGSLVRLESGRLGVVTEQSTNSLMAPKVKVFYAERTSAQITPRVVDLAALDGSDKI
jgi:HD-GYP domain-containing protein (c-di-GMP phosphodiesterase class II)